MNMKTIKLLTYIVMSIGMAFSAQAQAASGLMPDNRPCHHFGIYSTW